MTARGKVDARMERALCEQRRSSGWGLYGEPCHLPGCSCWSDPLVEQWTVEILRGDGWRVLGSRLSLRDAELLAESAGADGYRTLAYVPGAQEVRA